MANLTQAQRDKLPASDFAGPDRSYPITDQDDVDSAAHLIGKAADPEAVKRRIIAIAKKKGLKIPDAWRGDDTKESMMPDLLYFPGQELKASGNGEIRGLLVPFGSVDSDGDLFDGETDFDFDEGERRSGYFRHSLDPQFGNRKIGRGTLTKEARGVMLEGRLYLDDPAVEPVWERAKKGELGLSSGAPNHLVRRYEIKEGVTRVSHWPIAEWSTTPGPANENARILSVKEYLGAAGARSGAHAVGGGGGSGLTVEEQLLSSWREFLAVKQGAVFSSANLTSIQRVGDGVQRMYGHVARHATAPSADTQKAMLDELGQMQDLISNLLAAGGVSTGPTSLAGQMQRQLQMMMQAQKLSSLGVDVSRSGSGYPW